MYSNNAYNNDIFVVQGSIITVTKLMNNKSLLSEFYCEQRVLRAKNKSISTIIAQRGFSGSCILASLARNVKAVKIFYPGCNGTLKADIAIAYCILNNYRTVANK